MMNKLRKHLLMSLVLAPVASIGILGCGGVDPQPVDFDASASDAEPEREPERGAQPSVPGPAGESTTTEGP